MLGALLCALLATGPTDAKEDAPTPEPAPTGVDYESDSPPPTKFDLQQKQGEVPEERSLTGQLVRTVIMLMVVVGIIYVLGKVALQRGLGGASTTGTFIQVLDRVHVDTRNSLMLVRVSDDQSTLR